MWRKTSECIQNLSRIKSSVLFFVFSHLLCPRKILPGHKSVAHKAAVLEDYLPGSTWHSTISAVPWTTGTVPSLGIQFIISYLVSKSPTDRFWLASCSLPLTLLPTHTSPPHPDFSPCLTAGEFLLHLSCSIRPNALTSESDVLLQLLQMINTSHEKHHDETSRDST